MNDVQKGGVVISGLRESGEARWKLLPTFQGLTVSPLSDGLLGRTADLADTGPCAGWALWLRFQRAQLLAKAQQWTEADAGFQEAITVARAAGATRMESHLLMGWSETLVLRGSFDPARQHLEGALRLEEKRDPEGLGVVTVLLRLGNVAERQDRIDEADHLYRRAHGLVLCAAPGSGGEAAAANNLAVIAGRRGDLAQAQSHAGRALAVREKLTPTGPPIIPSLLTYGNIIYARGDSAGAESLFLRAKKILEEVLPESMALATTLHNLAELALERGDHDAAEDLFRREWALFEKIDPSRILARDSMIGLGRVALRQHRGAQAEEILRRALALNEKLDPRGPKEAICLEDLATAVMQQGRNTEAKEFLQSALAIWQEINPEAIHAGPPHLYLGLLLTQEHDQAAEAHLRTAIRLYAKEGKSSPEGYQALARLQAEREQMDEAGKGYLAAVNALEAHRERLGGAKESQWLYGSALGDLYFEAAEHQIALGRPQEAWRFLERGRARGFQELLAQRDLRFADALPAELYAERRRLATEYDRAQAALADWVRERGPEELRALEGRLRDLRLEQAEVQERIRRSSPRLEALENPTPLDLAAARAALDPGTVLLTYSVGESKSYLFVIEADGTPGPGFSFFSLGIGREDLEQEIGAFRGLLASPGTLLSAVQQRGRHLYDLLVRPAEPVLATADRWLISPDGPLHALPFAALLAGDRYLAEKNPVHVVASAAVYKEIRAARPEKPSTMPMELLAVGDPLYPASRETPAGTATDPQVQAARRRGFRLETLPATRDEVETISRLFPEGRALLGRHATEEGVKALAPRARRIHFACHGLLDERFPLNSGLALTIPEHPEEGRDNGLLQAWEIFESVRLDADLVTLSACDSGLGQEMGGEGLVGLVRAFQFAGARSVLASLWSVSDDSTATLMKRFYTYLRQGRTKDEALRAAQLDLLRSENREISHPYHWAGFSLYGDWR